MLIVKYIRERGVGLHFMNKWNNNFTLHIGYVTFIITKRFYAFRVLIEGESGCGGVVAACCMGSAETGVDLLPTDWSRTGHAGLMPKLRCDHDKVMEADWTPLVITSCNHAHFKFPNFSIYNPQNNNYIQIIFSWSTNTAKCYTLP